MVLSCLLRISLAFTAANTLCACRSSETGGPVAFHDVNSALAKVDPVLRSGDRVQITVFGEDSITGPYEITAAGLVQMPLAGPITAAGLTARELERQVASALRRKYMRDPNVTVAVLTVSPFYVLGEVEKPGEYPYRNGLNVWRAMAIAGGQTYRASTASVFIQHAGESRSAEVDLADDVTIKPGDLIRVPERWF